MLRTLSIGEVKEIEEVINEIFGDIGFIAYDGEDYESCYLGNNEDLYGISNLEELLIENKINSYSIEKGITKIVLIPEDKDYVIKIPITKIAYREFFYDNGEYHKGKFVIKDNVGGDYCKKEEEIYNSIDEEVKKMFAETKFLIEVNKLPIYIQEKIDFSFDNKCFNPDIFPSDRKSDMDIRTIVNSELSSKGINNLGRLNTEFCYDVMMNYGIDSFLLLIREINFWKIEDLHELNIGYKNYKPMIFDYSGFEE